MRKNLKRTKNYAIALAVFLSIVLIVFAFVSCGKEKTESTTANATQAAPANTTAASTAEGTAEHEHVPAAEYTVDSEASCSAPGSKSYHCTVCGKIIPETVVEIPALPHTPESEYSIVTPPTCSTPGEKAIYCYVCGLIIPGTTVPIPADENAHVVNNWVEKEATLLTTGSRSGDCTACNQHVEQIIEKTVPKIFDSGKRPIGTLVEQNDVIDKRRFYNIQAASDAKFYPTEASPLGNDLLIEFSFLWNDTLKNAGDGSDDSARFSIQIGEGYSVFELTLRPNHGNPNWSQVFGEISPRNHDAVLFPTPAANASIGSFGWHRIGVRLHQEAEIVNDAVKYTMICTYYVDGVKVLQSEVSDFIKSEPKRRLFNAEIVDGELVYSDPVNVYDANGQIKATEYFRFSSGAYLGLADISMTCGQDFVQDVIPVTNPESATLEVATGVTVPANIWYAFKQ